MAAISFPFPNLLHTTSPARSSRLISLPCKPLLLTGGHRQLSRQVIVRATSNGPQPGQGKDGSFSLFNLPTWARWVLGSLAWLIVPAFQRLQKFGEVVEKVDNVMEKIEEYAEKADKIAEELAADLPDGNFKKAVQGVEKVSEEIASKAKIVDDVLDKVTEIVDKLEDEHEKDGNIATKSEEL